MLVVLSHVDLCELELEYVLVALSHVNLCEPEVESVLVVLSHVDLFEWEPLPAWWFQLFAKYRGFFTALSDCTLEARKIEFWRMRKNEKELITCFF